MSKSRFRETSITSLAILLTIATAKPAASLNVHPLNVHPVIAQSPALEMQTTVPSGTTVDIDGSSSMTVTNQTFKQQFESQFPDTVVKINHGGNDAALQALRDRKIDLAAIGRPLTDAEKAEGLVLDPLSRPKIAIVVGQENPFKGSLTTEQFAKIFRGEITDWSEVGGAAGSILLIDRPETNDTRQAFQAYPVFQQAPFSTGATVRKLSDDSPEAVIKALGKDGISYAIVDQMTNQSGVRIVPMHDTLPSDSRYPFSQPLSYVYQGPEPNADARAFLGYITDPKGQLAAKAAGVTGAIAASPVVPVASPEAVAAPAAVSATPNSNLKTGENPPGALWWLALPVLGGLLWWLLKRSPSESATSLGASPVLSPVVAAKEVPDSRIILVPRTCKTAYAYWEVPEATQETLRRQGGEALMLRLYDVTDIDLETQSAHSVQQHECDARSPDHHLPIPVDNRDYIAELGYLTADNRWLKLARSAHVRVPACPVSNKIPSIVPETVPETVKKDTVRAASRLKDGVKPLIGVTGAAVAGTVIQSAIAHSSARKSRIILTPRNANSLYAYWEVAEDHKAELQQQGGQTMALRLYDGTDGDTSDSRFSHSFKEYECSEQDSDIHVPIVEHNRGYVAELGYVTDTGRWLKLARSAAVQVPTLPKQEVAPVEPSAEPAVKPINTDPTPANPAFDKTSVARTPTARVQHYGDFTPGDAATVQRYGDFTPGDIARVQHYGDFTPGDAATVQRYGKSAEWSIEDERVDQFNAVTNSLPKGQSLRSDDHFAGDRAVQNNRIILVPRSPKNAYVYWEISSIEREAAKRQGGIKLILRVYEVTNIDRDDISAHSVQQFECNEQQQDCPVAIPISDRNYVAEIGYVTVEDHWHSIIRSPHVRVPAA